MADAYDLLPYTEHAYAESHPDHLRVIAALAGWTLDVQGASDAPRVLELGCGRGGNLLPMAEACPEATFVGVDRSTAQTRDASQIAEAAGLQNVTFVTADFADVALESESFDFVLCHGVYSWVPVTARHTLLRRIRSALAESGVAYLSFNTLPGWYERLAARDWMRFAARASLPKGPRDSLAWLYGEVSPELASYRSDLRAVHDRLQATDAAYLAHEYLADEHHPVYVAELLAEAAEAGLTYLGDALPSETALELTSEEVQARARGLDLASALTLVDFARDTAFRRALLVRSDTATKRAFRAPERLDPHALSGLRLASRLRPVPGVAAAELESFEGAGATVHVSGVTRAALRALADAAPRSIACTELARSIGASVETVASELYDLWLASPGLDLRTREPTLCTASSRHPLAGAVARWHALEGGPVTNAWHQEVTLGEPILRFLLARLDGKTTVVELARQVQAAATNAAGVSEVEAIAIVRASVEVLAKAALLIE
jgi:SAM-dependent methyltransferase